MPQPKAPVLAAALVLAGAAIAHEGVTNPAVEARMQSMKAQGAALTVIGEMAKGARPFDAAEAAAARAALIDEAARTPALFETPATDPLTEALPAIWTDWPDFRARAAASVEAARALDAGSAASLADGLREVGAACAACHEVYRKEG